MAISTITLLWGRTLGIYFLVYGVKERLGDLRTGLHFLPLLSPAGVNPGNTQTLTHTCIYEICNPAINCQ